jgi:hypothetical protein
MVVGTVTKLRTGRSGVQISGGKRDLYLLQNAQTQPHAIFQAPAEKQMRTALFWAINPLNAELNPPAFC